MDNRYNDNPKECVIFDWIEIIKDHIQQLDHSLTSRQSKTCHDSVIFEHLDLDQENLDLFLKNCDIRATEENKNDKDKDLDGGITCPDIFTGDVIEDRKSVFQGHFARVDEVKKVRIVLDKLKENKKIKNSTHPTMHAYRIQQKGNYYSDVVISSSSYFNRLFV